jgi:phage tail sheath protein FI
MPDPLDPPPLGVYIEETVSTPPTIQPAGTSTAAFVGPGNAGPANAASEPLTSLASFQTIYGTSTSSADNLSLAVRAFFANGGQKLHISRVTSATGDNTSLNPDDYARALVLLEPLDDISTIAAPGASSPGIHAALIAHASRPQSYRLALLDPSPASSIADVQALRATLNSPFAALYYPWVNVANPLAPPTRAAAIKAPPSGFVAGIFARSDSQRGVSKAPANQPILGAASLERTLTNAEATTLNNSGINTLRVFPGRSILVWGARTLSGDPEWKYVNIRRYVNYLEHSIDTGTQWVVFEPNGEQLWANVRNTISNFLLNEWQNGGLLGTKPEQAFFVKCDRTTMTQNDLDNGRLICLIGVAPVRPAEFVIIRIGQWTADAKPPRP